VTVPPALKAFVPESVAESVTAVPEGTVIGVAPGGDVTLHFLVTASSTPGTYYNLSRHLLALTRTLQLAMWRAKPEAEGR
jgi:hypothetical protein